MREFLNGENVPELKRLLRNIIPPRVNTHPIVRWQNTVGVGLHIKTNIPATTAGNVYCHIYGDTERLLRGIDTQISFYHTAAGLATATQMTMLNKGLEYNPFSTFVDTDNTISIYLPHHEQRTLTYVEVYWGGTGTVVDREPRPNRAVDVIRVTNPITTGNQFVRCPLANVHNTGAGASNRTITRFVATENGTDDRRGNSRANACRTVAQALNLAGNTTSGLILTINRQVAAQPAAYDAAIPYAVNAEVSHAGFVWRRRVAGTGTTPALTAAGVEAWNIVLETAATCVLQTGVQWRGAYSTAAATTYVLGDVVTFATGLPSPNNNMTYICIQAIAGNNNVHTRPSGTLVPTRNWAPIGRFNPVLNVTTTIANCASLQINSTAPLLNVIQLVNLTVTNNNSVLIATPMVVGGTFTASTCGALSATGIFHANSIAAHNTGTVNFTTTLTASLISHTACGLVAYRGTTTVITDNPTRVAVTCRNSRVIFTGTTILRGNNRGASAAGNVAATNTAHAMTPNEGGIIEFTGGTSATNVTVTIEGFGGGYINASFGGVVRFNNRTMTLNISALNMLAQPATLATRFAIRAETTGTVIRGQNCQTINRNGMTDQRVTNGRFFDERNPQGTAIA